MKTRTIMGIISILAGLFGSSCTRDSSVRVEFVNAADDSTFAVSEMMPEQLPDSFLINTTFELEGEQWSVVSAEPERKEDFIKTRRLRVVLVKVITMSGANLQNILYSLPTISNELPPVTGDTQSHAGLYALHEDDWRQVEFVSESLEAFVDIELNEIDKIYQQERGDGGVGFKNMHIRKSIDQPLPTGSLSVDSVRKAFAPDREYEALSFERTAGTIPQSFAWTTSHGVDVWGQRRDDGSIAVLCVSGVPSADALTEWSADVATLLKENKLILVDWCRMSKTSEPTVRKYYEDLRTQIANQKLEPTPTSPVD